MKRVSGYLEEFGKRVLLSIVIMVVFVACTEECGPVQTPCERQVNNRITKTVILSASNTSYDLTVANVRGIIADAACHASMSIRYKWVDETNTSKPPIDIYCHTIFNYFPDPVPASFDSNGNYWVTSVDDAEDKSSPGETSYGIKATLADSWDASMGAVEVDLLVVFTIFDPAAYVID